MASKYSQSAMGVGCAGACGYVGVGAPKLASVRSQAPNFQNANVLGWNSVAYGDQFISVTYLAAYTQMLINMGMPANRTADIQNAIKSSWTGPNNVITDYNNFAFVNQIPALINITHETPFIPISSNTNFWNWVSAQVECMRVLS